MDYFIDLVIIGVSIGMIYALVALGISLIFSGLDIVHFAHDSGVSNVDEKTTLGAAVNAASPGSSGIWAANSDSSRYVFAPISAVCSAPPSSPIQARYSGPSMPQ